MDRRNATGRPENGELNLSEYLKGMQADAKKERDRERRNREFQDILNAAPNAWSPGGPSLSSRMWETPASSSASVAGPGKEMDLFSRPVRREVVPPSSTPLNSHSISVLIDTSRRLQPNSATPLETPVNEASKQRERPMVMSIPKLQR